MNLHNRRSILYTCLSLASLFASGCANANGDDNKSSKKPSNASLNENPEQYIPFVVPSDSCALSYDGLMLAITPDYKDFSHIRIIDLKNKAGFIIAPSIKGAVVDSVVFSPDSKAIAFTVQTASKMGIGEIWVKWLNEDRLEKIKWDYPRSPRFPVFSMDNKRLAYLRGIEDLSTKNGEPLPSYANCIFEWDFETKTETQITQIPYGSVNILNYMPNDKDFVFSGGEPLEFVNNAIWMSTKLQPICENCGRIVYRLKDANQNFIIKPLFEEKINGYEKTTYTVIGYAKSGVALVWFERLWRERIYLDSKQLESYLAIYKDGKYAIINNIEISGAFAISDNGKRVAKFTNAANGQNVTEGYIEIYDGTNKVDSFLASEINWQSKVVFI